MALFLTVRRLHPYFLSHLVTVLTNSTLRWILTNHEASERLIKWTTKLGEYDIQYQPMTVIKEQALADFLIETSDTCEPETRKVFVDGSSTKKGSGIGILLCSFKGDSLLVAIKLHFKASNNETKYETLLAGLQAARHVGATRVIICTDSQLTTQQIEGNFETCNDKLQRYAEAFNRLKTSFQDVTIQKIPRADNQKVDEMTRLASSLTSWE
ncbi:uncharacterized protein LOC141833171 [Curcuma longa]|uniref:uncharacterized protein LOC141833171 n=1 Tax=Curcuma longa TaxID=136217 RepID=UPI003D9F2FF4